MDREWAIAIGNRQSAIGNRQSAIANRQSAIGNRQSAIGNRQSAIGNRQSAIGNRQSAIGNKKAAQLSGGSRSASFWLERQLPTNRGGRFSKKAETPSTKSFVFPDS